MLAVCAGPKALTGSLIQGCRGACCAYKHDVTTPQPAGARVGSSPNRARRRWIVGVSAVALGLLAVLGVVVIVPLVNASSPPPAIAEHVLAGHTDTVWSGISQTPPSPIIQRNGWGSSACSRGAPNT